MTVAGGSLRAQNQRATVAPVRPSVLTGWTLHDPNGIVSAAAPGSPDGVSISLQGSAASRDLPGVGATYGRLLTTDALGGPLVSFTPQDVRAALRGMERRIPAVPDQMRWAHGWGDNINPTLCTSALLFGIDYPGAGVRRVTVYSCTALNTWNAIVTATGNATTFGVDGSYVPRSVTQITDRNALPLDSTGAIGAIAGGNVVNSTGLLSAASPGWTSELMFAGWLAAGGTSGTIEFAPAGWVFPLTGAG